jgi:hypothetical protein
MQLSQVAIKRTDLIIGKLLEQGTISAGQAIIARKKLARQELGHKRQRAAQEKRLLARLLAANEITLEQYVQRYHALSGLL